MFSTKLDRYLRKHRLSEPAFARTAKVSRTVVNRVRNGHGASAENLAAIVRATDGAVTLEDLLRDARRRDQLEGADAA